MKLLDTNIISAILRRNIRVIQPAQEYLQNNSVFALSLMTRYEILRGLKAKGALRQLELFNQFCSVNQILELNEAVIVQGAEIYAYLRQRGQPIGDADVLIGATALVYEMPLITDNEKHFRRIPNLQVENWLR